MSPKVTVITPTLNRLEMLRLTCASVRAQTYPNVEHIVMDGGSTDGTKDFLAVAAETWGIRWVSSRDGGMYEAINAGLKLATGKIVGWVNDDDWLLPWTFDTIVETMRDSDFRIPVYGDYLSATKVSDVARTRAMPKYDRRWLAATGYLPQPTVAWPSHLTEAVGPLDTDQFRQIADCDYWLRMAHYTDFVHIPELLAIDTHHDENKRNALSAVVASEFDQLRLKHVGRVQPTPWAYVRHRVALRRAAGERDRWRRARGSALLTFNANTFRRSDATVNIGRYRTYLGGIAQTTHREQ